MYFVKAVKTNYIDLVKTIVSSYEFSLVEYEDIQEALRICILQNQVEMFEILAKGLRKWERLDTFPSLLNYIEFNSHPRLVEIILQQDLDPNFFNLSTIQHLIQLDREEIILLLIENPLIDNDLILSCTTNPLVIKCMVENNVNINAYEGKCLEKIIQIGDLKTAEYLIFKGAVVYDHFRDIFQSTIIQDRIDLFFSFRDAGGNLNNDQYILDTIIQFAQKDLIKYIIQDRVECKTRHFLLAYQTNQIDILITLCQNYLIPMLLLQYLVEREDIETFIAVFPYIQSYLLYEIFVYSIQYYSQDIFNYLTEKVHIREDSLKVLICSKKPENQQTVPIFDTLVQLGNFNLQKELIYLAIRNQKKGIIIYLKRKGLKIKSKYSSLTRDQEMKNFIFSIVSKDFKLIRQKSDQDCSICLTEMKKNSISAELKCNHTFHQNCIETWLEIKENCPYCRQ